MTKEDIQRALDLARAALHHQNHGLASNKELLLAKALLHVHKTSAKALRIAANQLEGVSLAVKVHGQNINPAFFIEEYSRSAECARKALDDIGATE
jgi:hydroxypyruvate isomerase